MERENDKILFISATHGDEGFSGEVFRRIEQTFPRAEFGYDWIVGNPLAFERNTRFIEADLNRSAPGDPRSTVYEERRAAEIVRLSKNYDAVIDVHGTVADCGVVTIIPYPTLPNLTLTSVIPIERNIIWYSSQSFESGPLVQFTACPAVEIECGPKSSAKVAQDLEEVLAQILQANRFPSLPRMLSNLSAKEFYKVYGKEDGSGEGYKDFELVRNQDESFYPFLSKQYPGIACYKMSKVNFEDLFLI